MQLIFSNALSEALSKDIELSAPRRETLACLLTSAPSCKPRLHWEVHAAKVTGKVFMPYFAKQFEEALATAKP